MKLLLAASLMARTFRRSLAPGRSPAPGNLGIEQYPVSPIHQRNRRLLGEYERIAAELTRKTKFYFRAGSVRSRTRRKRSMCAGRDAPAIRRSRKTASCPRAFAP